MSPPVLPLIRPYVSYDDVSEDIKNIFDSGILSSGKYVERLESKVCDYLDVKYCFTTTSATTALHLSLVSMGLGIGDEVLFSDYTFPATANAIIQTGAIPVPVDSKSNSFVIDIKNAVKKVTKKTRAIIVVDPFGIPVVPAEIIEFSKTYDIKVVEDAACAFGSSFNGKKCGSWADTGCFSLHPRKLITAGEGGFITTNNRALAEKISVLRNHGGKKEGVAMVYYESGYNYRLSEIQAAIALQQIKNIDSIISERSKIVSLYLDKMNTISDIELPVMDEGAHTNWQSFVVLLNRNVKERDRIIEQTRKAGIETTIGTYSVHAQPYFSQYKTKKEILVNSYRYSTTSITLPLFPGMKEKDVELVVGTLKDVI